MKKRLEKIEEILLNPGEDSFAALTATIHRAAATGASLDGLAFTAVLTVDCKHRVLLRSD